MHESNKLNIVNWLRWIARILGTMIALLLLLFIIGEGLSSEKKVNLLAIPLNEQLMLAATFIMLLGLIIGWFKEGIAEFLLIGGFVMFAIVDAIERGQLWLTNPFLIMALIGVVYLICWRQTKRSRSGSL